MAPYRVLSLLGLLALGAAPVFSQPAGVDLARFEKKVRPLLAANCFKCHGEAKQKAHLRLDHISTILAGGDRGPAVVPGDPGRSLLLEAVRYENVGLQMPPGGKLSGPEIAELQAWVEAGAPWPSEPPRATAPTEAFDLEGRRRAHWVWHPLEVVPPPAVRDASWPRGPIDRFIASRLAEEGLRPAPPAEPRALFRRLAFDLTGLPPGPREVEAFLQDDAPDAIERAVDRMLASPAFGERWGRHWLDLVRYAETLGHEFDYTIHGAWRYRDYIVRAFNSDVPYDQLVHEHVAGDLLEDVRLGPDGIQESVTGTAFYWFGQQTHSPVDVRRHQADLIDNQIDVLSKTFLGLTVACARCHDHKFDAISTKDFHALYGILKSSRFAQRSIEPPGRVAEAARILGGLKRDLKAGAGAVIAEQARETAALLVAAREAALGSGAGGSPAARLGPWVQALGDRRAHEDPAHLFHVWAKLASTDHDADAAGFSARFRGVMEELQKTAETTRQDLEARVHFADFTTGPAPGWLAQGEAFAEGRVPHPGFRAGDAGKPLVRLLRRTWAHTGALSFRLEGALRSPTFKIERPYVHILASGRDARLGVVIDNFTLLRDPIYGGLRRFLSSDEPGWISIDLGMWLGHEAFIEASNVRVPDPSESRAFDPESYFALEHVFFSDSAAPPAAVEPPPALVLLGDAAVGSIHELAERHQRAVVESVAAWRSDLLEPETGAARTALLDWLLSRGLLDAGRGGEGSVEASGAPRIALPELAARIREVESSIHSPRRVPAMVDGDGRDAPVFIRGDPSRAGPVVQRRFLEALAGCEGPAPRSGSGRLELARALTDPSNPLVARVLVNRVWHHLFGRGIVSSVDDFGALGERPSHPELLDWLAHWFQTEGRWSAKELVRLLVASSTYRMSSAIADAAAEEKDPQNRLFHRGSLRRLEAEAVRDAILGVSGRLDRQMFGPSVPAHLTEFMRGRGLPSSSGPLDGAGRRSIYGEVRRNFLSPMMLAFDAPIPFTTTGRRNVSNVPAQALILMNDAFVQEEAALWARQLLLDEPTVPAARVREMYLAAFGRPPSPEEASAAGEFIEQEAEARGVPHEARWTDPGVWTDLCHAIFSTKELLFIE